MALTTKLLIWNGALREIGSHPLASTTSANTRQQELAGAWAHAIETTLAMRDWGFARRRATLSGVSDTGFPPYTYRYAKPSDYLRKCWVKTVADDEHQTDHAEIAAVIYGYQASVLLEYVSDHADNYEPANWPPHFTRLLTLHLALLVAPKLARAGAEDIGKLKGLADEALAAAEEQEAVFLTNVSIPSVRQPVMRRALEFIGQQLAGSVAIHSHADMLRWHMNRSWDHAVKFVLEQGAWNFASRRVMLTGGSEAIPGGTISDIGEGYSLPPVGPETAPDNLPDMAGYQYGYALPDDFLHKIWIKADANHALECDHQFLRDAVYSNYEPLVMEYVAWDDGSRNPEEWSASFMEVVAAYLAVLVTPEIMAAVGKRGAVKVSADGLRSKLESVFQSKLANAETRDAIQQKPVKPPSGRFVTARMGGSYFRRLR